jgi:hypothetical protein
VSKVRFILVALICESPAILLWDGLITRALVTGAVAAAMMITARALRSDETKFFVSIIRPLAVTAAVPALWMVMQVLPLRVLAHPMWKSAETALGHPLADTISIDLGASILALGQYLSMIAVVFLSAAIAVDRRRAEWLLFALSGACTLIGLIVLIHVSFPSGFGLPPFVPAPALDCVAIGTIIASAAGIRAIEHYETRRSSLPVLLRTSIASSVALAICILALLLGGTYQVLIAAACGCAMLAWVKVIRRAAPSGLSFMIVTVLVTIAAIFFTIVRPVESGKTLLLAFATSSAVTTAASERMLADTPLVGTGAGTFAALLPIYGETIDDSPASSVSAATTAATLAIELGAPMFWLIVTATVASIFVLFRASLRRGRDSFYPAMGGGCLVTLLLLAFNNAGLFGTATSLIAAVALGLALAQSRSRIVE